MNRVCVTMKEEWSSDDTVEKKWSVMKSALWEAADSILGPASRGKQIGLREKEAELRPLFKEISRLYTLWLNTGSERHKRKFMINSTQSCQKIIRDIQRGRWGLVPVRTAVVKDSSVYHPRTTESEMEEALHEDSEPSE